MSKIIYPIGWYAPGFYTGTCIACKEEFMGDKLARHCEPCAINTVNEMQKESSAKLRQLIKALRDVESGNASIKEILSNTDPL